MLSLFATPQDSYHNQHLEGSNIAVPTLVYCQHYKLPLLNLLAVRKESGRPDDDCGVSLTDLPAQQARVFVYDWLSHDVRQFERFLAARATGQSAAAATV